MAHEGECIFTEGIWCSLNDDTSWSLISMVASCRRWMILRKPRAEGSARLSDTHWKLLAAFSTVPMFPYSGNIYLYLRTK